MFQDVDTQEEAAESEAYLKKLIDRNEREVRRMVNEFQERISLVVVRLQSTSSGIQLTTLSTEPSDQ